jgi:Rrf2 family protein
LDYALSCVLRLADKYETGQPVSVAEIAKREHLATDYVEQIMITLKRAGILKSIRGVEGGYVLAVRPDRVTAKEIVFAIEKDVLKLVCARKKGRRHKCIHLECCQVKDFWLELRQEISDFLKRYSLESLLFLRRKEPHWLRG